MHINAFDPHTLTATSIILPIAASLLAGIFVSYISALLLWLTPGQKLAAFIMGFALMCDLAMAQPYRPTDQWWDVLMLHALPPLVSFIYFLPTIAAISVECKLFRGVFFINLCFGWTVIGWIVALLIALRPEERDIYGDLSCRFTPFGVVPSNAIGVNTDRPALSSSRHYVPPLRRDQ
jgi:hypothetical protein